ncbi:hypothetical protein [Azohydromonas aeria]|uniref:hypothetical protein n=1 Tax=Azohydromonas aeria TaxID=2590212 RepID=UPI0012FB4AD7|nr:hypothetical protein [Azohydromonas aeria]
MTTDYARKEPVTAEAHRAAIAAMPLQLLNYNADITPQQAEALQKEARRQLALLTSQPWREDEAHALMGRALREAARIVGVDANGLELRRGPPLPAAAPSIDQRSRLRTIQLNDARWDKLQALGPGWLEAKLDAEPGA